MGLLIDVGIVLIRNLESPQRRCHWVLERDGAWAWFSIQASCSVFLIFFAAAVSMGSLEGWDMTLLLDIGIVPNILDFLRSGGVNGF
jgi:hypothetical protein